MFIRFIGLVIVCFSVTSCCKTKECKCDLAEAYINVEAQKWVEPLVSQSIVVNGSHSGSDKLNSEYFQYFYCLGEGECCTDYPYLTLDYTTDSLGLKLFHVTALQDEVTFSTPDGGKLGILMVTTQKLVASDDVKITHYDTIYTGNNTEGIRIVNQNSRPGIAFLTLNYIKAVGVVSYMTLDSVRWSRN